MGTSNKRIPPLSLNYLREAALSAGSVGSLTANNHSMHATYRYPARFSPLFARAALETFSKPGDIIIDPFCGGGTTAIESLLAGRSSFNSDLSPLAHFLTKAKTTRYGPQSIRKTKLWAAECMQMKYPIIKQRETMPKHSNLYLGEMKNSNYRYLKSLLMAWEEETKKLGKAESLARLCLLRAGQIALDMKKQVPNLKQLRQILLTSTENTLNAAELFRENRKENSTSNQFCSVRCLDIKNIDKDKKLQAMQADAAIFSPPYPGMHILYSKWQILSRRETSIPFLIAGVDGKTNESFYTMGRRATTGNENKSTEEYLKNYRLGIQSLKEVLKPKAYVVQMIGFANPEIQLPQVLKELSRQGFSEKKYRSCETNSDGRLWRKVPGQKWYNSIREEVTSGSREVVLVHQAE